VRVGILGMAFKANVDDIRDSLSFKLAKILRFHGAQVVCSDEFAKDPQFVPADKLLRMCAVVIVGVPHRAYHELTVPPTIHLVDLWGVIPRPGQLKTAGAIPRPRRKTAKALQAVG